MAQDLTRTAGPDTAAAPEPSAPPASPTGFVLLDEIGRGGIGAIRPPGRTRRRHVLHAYRKDTAHWREGYQKLQRRPEQG